MRYVGVVYERCVGCLKGTNNYKFPIGETVVYGSGLNDSYKRIQGFNSKSVSGCNCQVEVKATNE